MNQKSEKPHKPRRLWPWTVTAIVGLCVAVGFSFWWPMNRANRVIAEIHERAQINIETNHPRWAFFLDEETFHPWFDQVTRIEVFEDPVDDAFVQDILAFSELKELRLNVSEVSPDTIRSIGELQQLESLRLHGNGATIPLNWLIQMRRLDYLLLGNLSVSGDDWQQIAKGRLSISEAWFEQMQLDKSAGRFCDSLPSLETLNIIECDVTKSFWTALSEKPSLKNIYLSDVEISDESMEALCDLSSLEFMKVWQNVDLNTNQVRQLSKLKQLKFLELENCELPDDECWLELRSLPNLQFPEFVNTNVGDTTASALAECDAIVELVFFETELTDAGLEQLQHLPNLRLLRVDYTKTTPAGIRRFQKNRPDVLISPDPDVLEQEIEEKRSEGSEIH